MSNLYFIVRVMKVGFTDIEILLIIREKVMLKSSVFLSLKPSGS